MDKNSKCRNCKYSRQLQGFISLHEELCCLYILEDGKPRGEPAGDECSKFTPRRKQKLGIRFKNSFPEFTKR